MHSSRERFREFRRKVWRGGLLLPDQDVAQTTSAREEAGARQAEQTGAKPGGVGSAATPARTAATAPIGAAQTPGGGAATGATEPAAAKPAADKRARKGYLREYRAWLRPFTGTIVFVFVVGVITGALELVLPRSTMYIIDRVVSTGDWRLLNALGIALLAVIVLG